MKFDTHFWYLAGISLVFAYDDLSRNKIATQTPMLSGAEYSPMNAVDRNYETCMRTDQVGLYSPLKTSWWRVDLGGVYNIYRITILFKNYDGFETRQRGRFAGFSLQVSITENNASPSLCYKDGPKLPPLIFTTSCMYSGRYVTFFNERLDGVNYPWGYELNIFTELCEIVVEGCIKFGVYGSGCDIPCPVNCRNRTCNIQNGECFECNPGWTGAMCLKKCKEGWYGENCTQPCVGHCRANTTCNHLTGLCDGGCGAGWIGYKCDERISQVFTYDDLSHHKSATQTPIYTGESVPLYEAKNAVDRNPTTCMRTENIGPNSPYKIVWWKVDLGGIYRIYSVNILFKLYPGYAIRQRGRFAGFSLYVSTNDGSLQSSSLCYKDGPELPPLNFTAVCIQSGRYVIFYNERLDGVRYPEGYEFVNAFTELCEVIIEGCTKPGVYGNTCETPCPIHCKNNDCNIKNGTCHECDPGWKGTTCQITCGKGWYGENCSQPCEGSCRDNSTCNHVTGQCDDGCEAGWTGSFCEKECANETFGFECTNNCSGNCLNDSPCNKQTGHCDRGCNPGYADIDCSRECSSGYFGTGCRETCSRHCINNTVCNHVSGICPNGCGNGYMGTHCNSTCKDGFYGNNCSLPCSQNCKETCHHADGFCSCKAGWMGSFCNEECLPGHFGVACRESCSGNCVNNTTCYHVNGVCLSGCQNGYIGQHCNQSCKEGYYGRNCSRVCPPNCKTCRNTDGLCTCMEGWMGYDCSYECHQSYGENCMHPCSENCINQTCDRFNGSCLLGRKDVDEDIPKAEETIWKIGFLILLAVLVIITIGACTIRRLRKSLREKSNKDSRRSASYVERSIDKDDSFHYQELDIYKDGDYENITLH